MKFTIGPYIYDLVLADRAIFDAEGNPLEGAAIESRRLLVISLNVEPERREEIAMHEFLHAIEFHIQPPRTEEERAQFFAFYSQQFRDEFEDQGGRAVLTRMMPRRLPAMGRPPLAARISVARDTFGSPDRIPCAGCEADVMCGSIHNGEPELHEATNRWYMERWFRCEGCAAIQAWLEYCTPDGVPLGTFVSNPKPRLLRGDDAAQWLAVQPAVSGSG
jgi:hypothetical protein